MRYEVTEDFDYHGLKMYAGEIVDDTVDYIASGHGIEPDMYPEWLRRGWIVPEGQAPVVESEDEAEG